jgi:hypothetical protein
MRVPITKVSLRDRVLAVGTVKELEASITAFREAAKQAIAMLDTLWDLKVRSLHVKVIIAKG